MQAFENFQTYLIDPSSYIDYTYLWDILSVPNSKFFENGINMCILEMSKDKSEVSLVCPTNNSISGFNPNKPTYIILQSYDHYLNQYISQK